MYTHKKNKENMTRLIRVPEGNQKLQYMKFVCYTKQAINHCTSFIIGEK